MESEFLKLQPKYIQEAYKIYSDGLFNGLAMEQIKTDIATEFSSRHGLTSDESTKLSKVFFDMFGSETFLKSFVETAHTSEDELAPSVSMTEYDYSLLVSKLSRHPDEDPNVISMLVALVTSYRNNYHKSGWIRYDRKNLIYLTNLSKLPSAKQELVTKRLHTDYGLEMQVVGSNNPIPCFGFPWISDQPEPGSEQNRFIKFGPLVPETIAHVRDKIIEAIKN